MLNHCLADAAQQYEMDGIAFSFFVFADGIDHFSRIDVAPNRKVEAAQELLDSVRIGN